MINENVIYIFILWAIRIYNVNPLVTICISCEYAYTLTQQHQWHHARMACDSVQYKKVLWNLNRKYLVNVCVGSLNGVSDPTQTLTKYFDNNSGFNFTILFCISHYGPFRRSHYGCDRKPSCTLWLMAPLDDQLWMPFLRDVTDVAA